MARAMKVEYDIKANLAMLENRRGGWRLELNAVSWNGEPWKYDIRPWNEDHTKCGKGITLTADNLAVITDWYCAQLKDGTEPPAEGSEVDW